MNWVGVAPAVFASSGRSVPTRLPEERGDEVGARILVLLRSPHTRSKCCRLMVDRWRPHSTNLPAIEPTRLSAR
jgi:hypothetical protein